MGRGPPLPWDPFNGSPGRCQPGVNEKLGPAIVAALPDLMRAVLGGALGVYIFRFFLNSKIWSKFVSSYTDSCRVGLPPMCNYFDVARAYRQVIGQTENNLGKVEVGH